MTELAGLRIALVGPVPPPAGGMAMQTRQLAELLSAEGAKVELVASNRAVGPEWLQRLRGLRAVPRQAVFYAQLWRACSRADLVHLMANSGWSWKLVAAPALRIAAARGCPVVVNYRGGGAPQFLASDGVAVRAALLRAAALVVPSGYLQATFAEHGMQAEVVPNIVNLERFHPRAGRLPPGLHAVVVRNLEPVYDVATALRAFAIVRAQVPDARISVAGSGPLESELRALAEALNVSAAVRFTGRLDRDAVAELLRSASVCVNPSRVDNMPNSVLEAMASGVPVVSTRVGGVPYIVRDRETALLVPAEDPQAMAGAMLELHAEPGLAQRVATSALDDVQQYAWSRVNGRWSEVYRRALDAGSPSFRSASA